MLRRLPREHLRFAQVLVAAAGPSDGVALQQARGMKLFEVGIVMRPILRRSLAATSADQMRSRSPCSQLFSKEKRAERRKKLHEDLQRGYFDDFKDFRDNQGKAFFAADRLTPPSQSAAFPPLQAALPDGTTTTFPPAADRNSAPAVSLVCVAFRAGAQGMLEAWAAPFSRRFGARPGTGAALVELSLVESRVMALWPFRGVLLRSGERSQASYAMPATYLYHFGDGEALQAALRMNNRLTGYVYLLDGQGRVRWRGSGKPEERELTAMDKCAEELVQEAEAAAAAAAELEADAPAPLSHEAP
jgi:ATPase complex subunit ATP10